MKIILCLALAVAIFTSNASSLISNAEFLSRMEQYRVEMQEVHLTMDYFMRDRRWEVSTQAKEWNSALISLIARTTTYVQELKASSYNAIIDRSQVIGNQNECLIGMDKKVTQNSVEAGTDIQACAATASNELTVAARDYFHDITNLIQRESTTAQHVHFYPMGLYNVLTQKQEIIDFMIMLDHEIEDKWPTWSSVWLVEDQAVIEYLKGVSIEDATTCLNDVSSKWDMVANTTLQEINACQ